MKIILTGKELKGGALVLKEVKDSTNSIIEVLGEAIQDIDVSETIGFNTIDEVNQKLVGICVITKYENTTNQDDSQFEFNINEDYICDYCKLSASLIADYFDVIKYAVKTAQTFVGIKLKAFKEKWIDSTSAH